MGELIEDIKDLLEKNLELDRGFVFLIERPDSVVLKGKFSKMDALNFIAALVQEIPEIKSEALRFIRLMKQPTEEKE